MSPIGGEPAERHPLMVWWVVLYALSMLTRYEPAKWTKMIDVNRSEQATAIEFVLDTALDAVPDLLDEAIGETGKWRLSERFETNFVDLAGDQGLLGQTAGRTKLTVTGWLDERGQDWKDGVQVVAMDPCAAYRRAVQQALPRAASRRRSFPCRAAGQPGSDRGPPACHPHPDRRTGPEDRPGLGQPPPPSTRPGKPVGEGFRHHVERPGRQ